jgi:hypothetical protein
LKARRLELALAAVRDLSPQRQPPSPDELADFETDVMAGFVSADTRPVSSSRCNTNRSITLSLR